MDVFAEWEDRKENVIEILREGDRYSTVGQTNLTAEEMIRYLAHCLQGSEYTIKKQNRQARQADEIVRAFSPIIQAMRPLILNGELIKDYSRDYHGT